VLHVNLRPMKSRELFDVTVIGAGLAGGASAHALAKRGLRVALVDTAGQIAPKASGNIFGLLTPYLTTRTSALETLYSAGYRFTHKLLSAANHSARFSPCGALQLPTTKRLQDLLRSPQPLLGAPLASRVSTKEASAIAGTTVSAPGAIHIPEAGFLSPRGFIAGLLAEYPHNISLFLNSECVEISQEVSAWRVTIVGDSVLRSNSLVLCSAYEAAGFALSSWLPLEAVRGQTLCLPPTEPSLNLKTVVSYGGYVTPALDQQHLIGAHYSHDDAELEPRDTDNESMLSLCAKWLPELALSNSNATQARVCFRTSTIDRIPYIGALPDYHSFERIASHFRSGTDLAARVSVATFPGVFINVGHGSRGLLSCPIAGEIIARLILRESLGELSDVAKITDPGRLPLRLLIKNRQHTGNRGPNI
jgi:tRNA 5-methylaminomethyl-2-thiouridine biosynthesis bifunctional protein